MVRFDAKLADQAYELRELVAAETGRISAESGRLRSLAVTSGKGGVGKSSISANLALALGRLGKRVALLDADLGLANLDLLLGVTSRYNLAHVIRGERRLEEVLVEVDEGVLIVPGGVGMADIADLDPRRQLALIESLSVLDSMADVLIVDTGAGLHRTVVSFCLATDSVLLLTTPEPAAVRDCYGMLKVLAFSGGTGIDVNLVVNMASSDEEAASVASRVQMAAAQFLGISVPYAGYVLRDEAVRRAAETSRPFLIYQPGCAASQCVRWIASRLAKAGPSGELPPKAVVGRGVKGFLFRLAKRLTRSR
ncbi:MAG: flagellar biosynthesis protein FlhG [Synergistaceae bacterium]|nr:flagellar biosynthesis protein FlhG [Synergistaceae bacterium]